MILLKLSLYIQYEQMSSGQGLDLNFKKGKKKKQLNIAKF